jgi:hypothetical protein
MPKKYQTNLITNFLAYKNLDISNLIDFIAPARWGNKSIGH